ncbi:MAG: hypothetical protein NTX25_13300 [Proteobacteria bacterium]|nr:hypothetical protein [Pseudomonadota bacterium]
MINQESPLNSLPEKANIDPAYTGDVRESLEDTAAKLHTIADQMRLQLHLAGLEAKDYSADLLESLEQMTQKLNTYANRLETKAESSEVQLHLGILEVKDSWEKAQQMANNTFSILKKDKVKAKQLLRELQETAQIAKLETKDALKSTRDDLKHNFKEISQLGREALHLMNQSISEFVKHLN